VRCVKGVGEPKKGKKKLRHIQSAFFFLKRIQNNESDSLDMVEFHILQNYFRHQFGTQIKSTQQYPTSYRSRALPSPRALRPVISNPRLSAATQNRLPAWRGPDPPWCGKHVRLRKDWAAGYMRVALGVGEVAVMYLVQVRFV
jgi:hypothetical protein